MGFTLLSPFRNIAYCNVFYFLTAFSLLYLGMTVLTGVSFFFTSKSKLTFVSVLSYFVLLFWMIVGYIQQRTLYSMCVNSMGGGASMAEVKTTVGSTTSSADYLL
jgi:hypothetical protein